MTARYLYNSIWGILGVESSEGEYISNYTTRRYPEYIGNITKYDEVIHEDSTTGRELCEKALGEVICSAYGNINIETATDEKSKISKRFLVIADGANFGSIMEDLLLLSLNKELEIYLIMPESTEYVLLNNEVFDKDISVEESLLHPEEVYESTRWVTYEKMYENIIKSSSSKIEGLLKYKKTNGLNCYLSEDFINTYSSVLTRIDGIKSSYNVKYSVYKIVNGILVSDDNCVNTSNINLLNVDNKIR